MKMTEARLNTLIDNLNNLICEEKLLTRAEREDMVRTVAAIGAMRARVGMNKPAPSAANNSPAEKKERVIDPRFPHAGDAWREEEESMVRDVLDPVPDEEIDRHLFWLAEKLGRSLFSVACKVQQMRNLPKQWKKPFQKVSDDIRLSGLTITEYVKTKGIE